MADGQRSTAVHSVATGAALWSGLSLASRRLLVCGGILLLAMMGMVGVAIYNLRTTALDGAGRDMNRLDFAIAEQTDRSFQALDLVVSALRAGVETGQGVAPLDLPPATQHLLLPQASGFALVGANGAIISHTPNWPDIDQVGAAADYLIYFRSHNDRGLFISRPFPDATRAKWFIYVARRLDGADGAFRGVAVGLLDLDYFRDFYRALIGQSTIAVALFNRDGITLASYPLPLPVGQRPPTLNKQWNRIVASGQRSNFITHGLIRHALRIISVTPLHDYPLVVSVSLPKERALAGWWRQAILTIAGTACATLCMILLLRAIMLQLRRLEQSESSLAEQSALLTTTLEHINDGVAMVDAHGRVVVCNTRAMTLLDLPLGLMASRPSIETVVAYQRALGEYPNEAAADRYLQDLRADTPSTTERRRPNGITLEIRNLPLPDGGIIRTYTDMTERRRSEAQIRYLAHHDPLTGLANRTLFATKLHEEIERADTGGHEVALLYLDLDRFKFVNDTRGHAVGDQLLVQVATRLRAAAGPGSTLARMGGDEFAAILPLDAPKRNANQQARALLRAVQAPIEIEHSLFRIGLSVGIALYPGHARNASDLLRNADIALYQAKVAGSGLWRVFDAAMQARQKLLFEREQDLRTALERKQFALAYQPIVDTGDGHAVGCEALLRWHHPAHGLIPPIDFVTLAERIGLIVPLGRWVLETACHEAAAWPADTYVAVNLSPIQINDEGLAGEVRAILDRTGLPPHRLTLEVTEGSLLQDNPTVRHTMRALRSIGIRFSLDDFGTGHAGLGYLRRFPFDGIKIDKLFIQDMVEQPDAAAIVNALLAVSAELHLDVIAEGVETEAQFKALKQRQCRLVQGHYAARPLAGDDVRHFIAAHRPKTAVL